MLLYILATAFTLCYGENTSPGPNEIDLGCGNSTIYGPTMPLIKHGNSIYYVEYMFKASASLAEAFCRRYNMHLLSIETKEEDDFLRETIRPNYYNDIISIRTSGRRISGGHWIWESTGKQIQFNNWDRGEPNNQGGNEDCLVLLYTSTWNDLNCDQACYFICEYSLQQVQPIQDPAGA